MGKETFRTRCLLKLNVISGIVKVLPPGTSASSIEFGWVVSPCLPLAWELVLAPKRREILNQNQLKLICFEQSCSFFRDQGNALLFRILNSFFRSRVKL